MKRLLTILILLLAGPSVAACSAEGAAGDTVGGGNDLYDVSELVASVSDGVVAVTNEQVRLDPAGNPQEVPTGSGTGIVVDEEGRVITNAHVIQNAVGVFVVGRDGQRRNAEVVAASPSRDLALLVVEDPDGLDPIEPGSLDEVEVGDAAIAIGNALGINAARPTVSAGIVSALDRRIHTPTAILDNLIQTDAAINPGNSGGPLLNGEGSVIGINTVIAGQAQNVGFAIPMDDALRFIEQFDAGEGETFLGVSLVDNSPIAAQQLGIEETSGAVIVAVVEGSAAHKAGLRPGDVVISFDGTAIKTTADLTSAIRDSKPGKTVELSVVNAKGTRTVEVTLGERSLSL